MVDSRNSNGRRRANDRFLAWLRLESLILLAAFPVTAMILEATTDWTLNGTWVSLYIGGVIGVIVIALRGIPKSGGNNG